MSKIDLIIDALERANELWLTEPMGGQAIAAAHELRDDLYAQEMEQPTPNQSGVFSVRDIREPWYKYATDAQIMSEAKLRGLLGNDANF